MKSRIKKHKLLIGLASILLIGSVVLLAIQHIYAPPDSTESESSPILDSDSEHVIDCEAVEQAISTVQITDELPELLIRQERSSYTTVEEAMMADGSIGVLSIPSIDLLEPVFESEDTMEAMKKGIAHFPETSAWDGNVGFSSHNRTSTGQGACFKDLHQVQVGDTVVYRTGLGEREYRVESVVEIGEKDWSYFSYTEDNRITMITCVKDKPNNRLCVQAVEIGGD